MMLVTGQPVWQKGTPQSMQRAPCSRMLVFRERIVDLEPVVDAFGGGTPLGHFARVFEEACYFTHGCHLPCVGSL